MTQLYNALGAALALLSATLSGVNFAPESRPASSYPAAMQAMGSAPLIDASGVGVSPGAYQRVVSASTVADSVLLDLIEPGRTVAFTAYSMNQGWQRHRYGARAAIASINEVETILSLKPDLVLASLHGAEQQVARLREIGIPVFNLGEMRGVAGFVASVRTLAALLQVPERGEQYATTFLNRLQRVVQGLPDTQRKSVAYVALFSGKLYGSGRNTNYSDVFRYAGLLDKGSASYEGFPEYSAEQLLELNPDLIVARENTRTQLCGHPGLSTLRACSDPQQNILELPEAIISSAGAEMLLATEAVHEFAYGQRDLRP